MANKNQKIVFRGKTSYAKVLGDPVLNYSKDGKEWKTDVIIEDSTEKEMKACGIGDRVKKKDDYLAGRKYVTFKQKEFRADGTRNEPITVVDILGDAWNQKVLIGNESDVEITANIVDYGPGKRPGFYIRKMRVLKLVPYAGETVSEISPDDPFYAEAEAARARKAQEDAQFKKDFGLAPEAEDLDDPLD